MAFAYRGPRWKPFALATRSAALPWSAVKDQHVWACSVPFHISDVTGDGAEPWQSDSPLLAEVSLRAHVHPPDEVLLVNEGVVGAQRAGGVIIVLVVVAQIRLPLGGDVLVHVKLVAHGHHGEDTCGDRKPT